MNFWKSHFSEELLEIVDQIHRQADYPYVKEYVDIPWFSSVCLHLLYLFLRECDISKQKIKSYCVTTALIQMGLDSHEQIQLDNNLNEKEIRSRQLTVLAGDYFSSRYYYLLAEMEDVEVVKSLAKNVQKINEKKISLYQKKNNNALSGVEYFELLNEIDTLLYTSFIELFKERSKWTISWKMIIRELALIERLYAEFQRFQFQKEGEKKSEIFSYVQVYDMIRLGLDSSRQLIAVLKNRDTRHDLKELVRFFTSQTTKSHRVLEEL